MASLTSMKRSPTGKQIDTVPTPPHSSLDDLQQIAVDALRSYLTADDEPRSARTERLREVAEAFVGAREHFLAKDGSPDYLGRTYAYRLWVRSVMSLANIAGEDLTTVQAAIRYHTSAVLRETVDPETLEGLGLRPESARERSVEKRERNSETLALFAGGQRLTDADDMVRVAQLVESALLRVSVPSVRSLPAKSRAEVADAFRRVCAIAEEVIDAGGEAASQ